MTTKTASRRVPTVARPSFAEVHATHRAEVLRFLTRRLGAQEAEDLAQEVFAKVALALPEFRGESSVRTWVFRMARNAAIDRIRQRTVQRAEVGGAQPELAALNEQDSVRPEREPESSEHLLIREEMRACIRDRLERLPEPYRAVLLLSESGGLADAEIASAVGTSVANAKIRLHRARARLRQDLRCHCILYRDERNELGCERKVSSTG
jgi:RNA polymerase sigma-70 factor, ECF subfamily